MNLALWREAVKSPRFALIDFWIVVICAGVLCLFPDLWVWSLVIALIPWGFRISVGESPFRKTGFDWLMAGFVVTAGAGYWASYDKQIGSTKFILLIASVLLFYALSSQPQGNLVWISAALFCVGLGVSVYFFLTHDFLMSPRKLEVVNTVGRWIMQIRPSLNWKPIHPNYISGLAAITTPFIFHPLWTIRKDKRRRPLLLIIAAGLCLVLSAMFMATSRGVLMAIASAAGVWVLWRIVQLKGINFRLGKGAVFPFLVSLFLISVVVLLYMGPGLAGSNVSGSSYYGDGSRAELVQRSMYLAADFPFTGGGLGSYPGLYSQYMLGIPYYYLPNAHNMFLDVFIEQGIPGGFIYLVLYVAGIWQTARVVTLTKSPEMKVFGWLALATLVMAFVHGMVDDYLYNGKGAILAMVPVGVSSINSQSTMAIGRKPMPRVRIPALAAGIFLISLFIVNRDRIQSAWYANFGAVRMAQVELAGFPSSKWAGQEIVPFLTNSEASLLSSFEANPANRTANHRLGLISMLRRDFSTAARYLERAQAEVPGHRGITKALGYCYVWLAQFDKAQFVLKRIPEARDELGAYEWWWQVQGRADLTERANAMKIILNNGAVLP